MIHPAVPLPVRGEIDSADADFDDELDDELEGVDFGPRHEVPEAASEVSASFGVTHGEPVPVGRDRGQHHDRQEHG